MAFTESEKLDICKVVGITADLLEDVLTFRAAAITSTVEGKVRTELTRWTTAGGDFVKVHPRERNYGVEINSENEKADIRKNIATLLFLQEYVSAGNGQMRVVRG